jgi:hypothetical protein
MNTNSSTSDFPNSQDFENGILLSFTFFVGSAAILHFNNLNKNKD